MLFESDSQTACLSSLSINIHALIDVLKAKGLVSESEIASSVVRLSKACDAVKVVERGIPIGFDEFGIGKQ